MSLLTNCKYRSDARPETFNARDNVSQFIKWARRVAGVREVLMFESDDLILRKNEKNFLLCLLEIARFGAKFGVSVPAIIKLEDEIEREIERDKQKTEKLSIIELQHLQREQEVENNSNQSTDEYQINANSNDTNWLEQQITQFPKVDNDGYDDNNNNNNNINNNNDSNQCENSDESNDNIVPNEVTTTTIATSNDEPQFSRTVGEEKSKPIVPPASSSHLHKTVRRK